MSTKAILSKCSGQGTGADRLPWDGVSKRGQRRGEAAGVEVLQPEGTRSTPGTQRWKDATEVVRLHHLPVLSLRFLFKTEATLITLPLGASLGRRGENATCDAPGCPFIPTSPRVGAKASAGRLCGAGGGTSVQEVSRAGQGAWAGQGGLAAALQARARRLHIKDCLQPGELLGSSGSAAGSLGRRLWGGGRGLVLSGNCLLTADAGCYSVSSGQGNEQWRIWGQVWEVPGG